MDLAAEAFHPTVLVGLRAKLRVSERPRRLFDDVRAVAKRTGAMGSRARVLDSTPLFDAVATQDTVTQLRAAIRKLLASVGVTLAAGVRAVLTRDDDYASPGKPPCDWDDPEAREALVDALVRDALAALAVVEGEALEGAAAEAAELLALVAGQDVARSADGCFAIVRGTAKDWVISTVDPEARHGHKSRSRHFDGYKAHLSVDPDSELIDDVVATPANAPDRDAVDDLLEDLAGEEDKPTVVGDSAYADGATRERLEDKGFEVRAKVPPARNATGGYTKDRFGIDLGAGTATCPAGNTVAIRYASNGTGRASFAPHCDTCPLRSSCTSSAAGRTIAIGVHEERLQRAKAEQATPEWQHRYRADRPIVERKIAHLMRVLWGGRHARVRGRQRVDFDLATRASAVNLARLATLGLRYEGGWSLATA